MNDNQKLAIGAALTVTAVVLSVKEYLQIRRVERETRAKIEADTKAQIRAMDRATGIVIERIREGKYEHGGMGAVMNDFKFESIIARIEEGEL